MVPERVCVEFIIRLKVPELDCIPVVQESRCAIAVMHETPLHSGPKFIMKKEVLIRGRGVIESATWLSDEAWERIDCRIVMENLMAFDDAPTIDADSTTS